MRRQAMIRPGPEIDEDDPTAGRLHDIRGFQIAMQYQPAVDGARARADILAVVGRLDPAQFAFILNDAGVRPRRNSSDADDPVDIARAVDGDHVRVGGSACEALSLQEARAASAALCIASV